MRLLPLGNDSDRSWRWYGENDPYYGVLSGDEFRKTNLSKETLTAFFESGSSHVDRVMNILARHLGAIETGSCLDFGCGVGRLVIPFARRFGNVSGVDISEAMIREAQKNCREFGIDNAVFFPKIAAAPGQYDLVHSYIVIQHIPVARGLAIIDELIDRLKPAGVAFIQISIGRNSGVLRDWATSLRKNVPPVHWLLNALKGRNVADAYMQVNRYPLNQLLAHLYDRGIHQFWCELENHQGSYGVCLAFRR